jgi:hypothetical protein
VPKLAGETTGLALTHRRYVSAQTEVIASDELQRNIHPSPMQWYRLN